MKYQFTIPIATPSLNETLGKHWAARKKIYKPWILNLFVATATIPRATGKRRLTVDRHGKRMLDTDNLIGGAKGVIDIIKKLYLIIDDDQSNLDLVMTQTKLAKGHKPHTVFTLEDL